MNAYEYDEFGNPTSQSVAEKDTSKIEKITAQPEKELTIEEIDAKLQEVEKM